MTHYYMLTGQELNISSLFTQITGGGFWNQGNTLTCSQKFAALYTYIDMCTLLIPGYTLGRVWPRGTGLASFWLLTRFSYIFMLFDGNVGDPMSARLSRTWCCDFWSRTASISILAGRLWLTSRLAKLAAAADSAALPPLMGAVRDRVCLTGRCWTC